MPVHPLKDELAHLREFDVGAIEQLDAAILLVPVLGVEW
jgi:hypothetical protein